MPIVKKIIPLLAFSNLEKVNIDKTIPTMIRIMLTAYKTSMLYPADHASSAINHCQISSEKPQPIKHTRINDIPATSIDLVSTEICDLVYVFLTAVSC